MNPSTWESRDLVVLKTIVETFDDPACYKLSREELKARPASALTRFSVPCGL